MPRHKPTKTKKHAIKKVKTRDLWRTSVLTINGMPVMVCDSLRDGVILVSPATRDAIYARRNDDMYL